MKIRTALIVLVCFLGVCVSSIFFFGFLLDNYPVIIVGMSTVEDPANVFLVNGTKVGDAHGFCRIYRKGEWSVVLERDGKQQEVKISERFRIGEPTRDELGLRVLVASQDFQLQEEYGCDALFAGPSWSLPSRMRGL